MQGENRVFGYPLRTICGVDFPVELRFDQMNDEYNDKYEKVASSPKAVASGLNVIKAMRWNYCSPDSYYKVKLCLMQKGVRELQAERVTGETKLKNIYWVGLLGNSTLIHLYSRCNNPHEEYRWLSLEIEAVPPVR